MKSYEASGASRLARRCIAGALLVAFYAAPAGATVFAGTIVDSAGTPVGGAHVSINHGASLTTAADGRFSIDAPRLATGDSVVASSDRLLANELLVPAATTTTSLSVSLTAMPVDDPTLRPSDPARCITCHLDYADGGGWLQRSPRMIHLCS